MLAAVLSAACDEGNEGNVIGNDEDESRAVLLPSLSGIAADGYACFDVQTVCESPLSLDITVDGAQAWTWHEPGHSDSAAGLTPPSRVCLDTDSLTEASHDFVLEVGCPGQLLTSPAATLRTRHSLVEVTSVHRDRRHYQAGATVSIDFELSAAGFVPSVDFSALDTGYQPGAESVVDLGGGVYRVSYTMSAANTRPSGDYRLPYRIADATGGAPVSGMVSVRYLPSGPMRHAVAGGAFVPSEAPTWRTDGGLRLLSITDTGVDVEPVALDEELPAFDSVSGPTRAGRVFELRARSAGPSPRVLYAIVDDPARDGHVRAQLQPTNVACRRNCDYTAELIVDAKAGSGGLPTLPLEVAVVDLKDGLGTLPSVIEAPPHTPVFDNYLIKGTVKYTANTWTVNEQACADQFTCTTIAPETPDSIPEGMIVRVVTGCNESRYAWVDDEGYFEIPFQSQCGNDHARIRISSYAEPVPQHVSVFRRAVPSQATTWAGWRNDLTSNPSDYRVYNEWLLVDGADTKFIPALEALAESPLVIDAQVQSEDLANAIHVAKIARQAQNYYLPLVGNKLHGFNVLLNLTVDLPGMSSHYQPSVHPGFMHIAPFHRWSEFILAHETGHYLHEQFGRDGSEYYGRFSEPMAHVHAASILKSQWAVLENQSENLDYNGKVVDGEVVQADMNFYVDDNDPNIPANPACNAVPHPEYPNQLVWDHHCCGGDANNGTTDITAEITACMMVESQGWYWRIFFDLADDDAVGEPEDFGFPGFDQVGGWSDNPLDDPTLDVVMHYLGGAALPQNPAYQDRGIPHGDIVDVLDGMMCRGHMSFSVSTVSFLHGVMNFDYDFNAPANCP